MKKAFVIALVLLVAVGMTVTAASAIKPGTDFNGPHYNLNLIAKKWDYGSHEDQFDNPDRGTIFVPLEITDDYQYSIVTKQGDILNFDGVQFLFTQNTEAEDFSVIDGNAIDDGTCELELPDGKYEVYISVKAKDPKIDNAYTDIVANVFVENDTDYWLINVGNVNIKKSDGWMDATGLFFVTPGENPFYSLKDYSLYEDSLYGDYGMWVFDYMGIYLPDVSQENELGLYDAFYFWNLDNNGNKLIQLRFYPI